MAFRFPLAGDPAVPSASATLVALPGFHVKTSPFLRPPERRDVHDIKGIYAFDAPARPW
jgi:hypothetical protein